MQEVKSSVTDQIEANQVVGFVREVISTLVDQQIRGFAQMVAYNLLFATAPLLMVIAAGAAAITRAVNSDYQNPAQPVLEWMQETLPSEAAAFLNEPIESALRADTQWVFSFGALFTLWGARGAVAAIVRGLNKSYGIDRDPRSFIQKNVLYIGLTLMLVILVGLGGAVFALGTDIGERASTAVGLGDTWSRISELIRFPLITAIAVFIVMVLHRYGPVERGPFRWYLPGSIFTVVGMYVATLGLGFLFSRMGGFAATYGIFGSVMAFIFWLFIMGFVILAGGVINAVIHRQLSISKTNWA